MKIYMAPLEEVTEYIYRNAYHAFFSPMDKYFAPFIAAKQNKGPGLRQLPLHKTSCKIAGSRLNSGFFIAKTCQFFEKYLLYVLCGVVLYGIILV